jgi:DNA-binding XRE family transcriptional regulator
MSNQAMSEKKSNGQVPEEGPDGKNLEQSSIKKSLGEVLKQHREECKMTQEFVAESIGVSRQAVSKWETGASDPSTSNLLTLAKLFNTTAEELLREVQ